MFREIFSRHIRRGDDSHSDIDVLRSGRVRNKNQMNEFDKCKSDDGVNSGLEWH